MYRSILAGALLALTPAFATAQATGHQPGHGDHAAHHAAHPGAGMKNPCPLHLTTLDLTPAQDSSVRAIRAAHMDEMKAAKAAAGGKVPADTMKASMARAKEAVRALLTDAQRTTFDAAVSAHEAEKAEMKARGEAHDCEKCCAAHREEHGAAHANHHAQPAKP